MNAKIGYTPDVLTILSSRKKGKYTELFKNIVVPVSLLLSTSSFNHNGSQLFNTSLSEEIEIPYSSWHKLIELKIGEPIYRSPDGDYQVYVTRNPSIELIAFKNGDIQVIQKTPGGHTILFVAKKP